MKQQMQGPTLAADRSWVVRARRIYVRKGELREVARRRQQVYLAHTGEQEKRTLLEVVKPDAS
jgi:hypothetical protein